MTEQVQAQQRYSWRGLIGYEEQKARLQALVHSSNLPQVMLFFGRAGIGKARFISSLVALHFCESKNACGHCHHCNLVVEGEHPEVLCLSGENETIKTQQAGLVTEHLSFNPSYSKDNPNRVRIVVLLDCDHMTDAATNRLLKTLEEPGPYARIFLTTSKPKALLPTILSRSVKWQISPPTADEVGSWLAENYQDAIVDRGLSEEQVAALIRECQYSPGAVAERLCDDSNAKGLGSDARSELYDLLSAKNSTEVVRVAESLARVHKIRLQDALIEIEKEIGKQYRDYPKGESWCPEAIVRRRRRLREIKKRALDENISLNSQLAFEGLGLATFQARQRI